MLAPLVGGIKLCIQVLVPFAHDAAMLLVARALSLMELKLMLQTLLAPLLWGTVSLFV